MEFVGGVEFVQGGLDVWALITQNLLKKFLRFVSDFIGRSFGSGHIYAYFMY
jgi:hypothetical protein